MSSNTFKATPMGTRPGWEINTRITLYQLWGPSDEPIRDWMDKDQQPIRRRQQWAAAWSDWETLHGKFVEADTLDEVLEMFPTKIKEAFKEVAE